MNWDLTWHMLAPRVSTLGRVLSCAWRRLPSQEGGIEVALLMMYVRGLSYAVGLNRSFSSCTLASKSANKGDTPNPTKSDLV